MSQNPTDQAGSADNDPTTTTSAAQPTSLAEGFTTSADGTPAFAGVQITDFEAGLDALARAHAIKEEYRAWKKNAPLLYDTIINSQLEQVSLTVEWFPDVTHNQEKNYMAHRILTGTQASAGTQNAILVSEVKLPTETKSNTDGAYQKKLTNTGRVDVVQRILHEGDVHRARYMPQNPNILATKSSTENVYLFDRTQHPTKPSKTQEFNPQLRLSGHTQTGYGLCWSGLTPGKLLSGSGDKQVVMWDISQSGVNMSSTTDDKTATTSGGDKAVADATATSSALQTKNAHAPLQIFTAHTDIVEDVAFHPTEDHTFISCGDDKMICVWDSRTGGAPVFVIKAHSEEVNSISINPTDPNLFLSGSSDKTVALWDVRNVKQKLHSFEHHQGQIYSLEWSPFKNSVFASSDTDRQVIIWDMERIGEEQDPDDAEDGPPELFFSHRGHTDKINDIAWASTRDWLLASVADDEILQVWEPAKALRDEVYDDEVGDDDDLLDEDLE